MPTSQEWTKNAHRPKAIRRNGFRLGEIVAGVNKSARARPPLSHPPTLASDCLSLRIRPFAANFSVGGRAFLALPNRDRPFAMPSGVGGTVSAVLPFTAEGSRVSAFEATPPLTAGGARRNAAGGGRSLPFAHVEHGRSSADFRQEIQDASRCLSRACARPQRLTLRGRKGQGPFPEDCPPCRKKTPSSCCSARAC